MDWSKTKIIFIIIFLLLDIFLGYQLIEKRSSSQFDLILETTTEEQLESDSITYGELPKNNEKEHYLSGKSKVFTDSDVRKLKNEQNITMPTPTTIHSILKNPYALPDTMKDLTISQFVRDHVLHGDEYIFWKYGDKGSKAYFFQQYNKKTIYKNVNGMLVLHVNKKNEIVSYKQTYLENIEKYDKKDDLLPALKAIEILYKKNLLTPGSKITKIELGYYALVQFNLSQSQVLTPTWHIVVNDKFEYFVNAFEGQVNNDDDEWMLE